MRLFCISLYLWAALSQGQNSSQQRTVQQLPLSGDELTKVLTEPNGLEKAANRYGSFMLSGERKTISDGNLAELVQDSALVVVGKVTQLQSRLIDDGDDIVTDCTIPPEEVMKGSRQGDVKFTVRGGRVTFASGKFAEFQSHEWEPFAVGGALSGYAFLRR